MRCCGMRQTFEQSIDHDSQYDTRSTFARFRRLTKVLKSLSRVKRELLKSPSPYGFDIARFAHVNREEFISSVVKLLEQA